MKVLTIRQPWASLIINNHKKYEFRTWKTKYRGKILIHAGSIIDKEYKQFESYNLEYIKSAIIGSADIVDCILIDDKFNNKLIKENSKLYQNNLENYAWKLENIKKFDKPIYCKGKLSLWEYEERNKE